MPNTINGLPTHPLLAHVVVVFVPLTALLAVFVVVWPAARRRLGGASLFVAAATLVTIPLTTRSGAWLERHVMMGGEVLRRHAALGGQLVFWFALLTTAMVFWWALHSPLFAGEVATLSPAVRRLAIALVGAGTLLFAVVSAWSIVLVGDTGAQSVWGGPTCGKMMGM
ncbi:hypothetical protein [Mycobacterium intracellulare]|uniref:hypothetical protein n=1 Tax=Mycobacterium intracellulare TaxID=1767 RepID=UPI0006DA76AB|nr:hypothetical protein [Mycobacterium intracellulare]KPN46485.1 hypothetical protein AN933_26045 [Mycobacterium intracellulare subsp. chimaera]